MMHAFRQFASSSGMMVWMRAKAAFFVVKGVFRKVNIPLKKYPTAAKIMRRWIFVVIFL